MKDLKFNDEVLMVKNCDRADLKDISDDISNLKEENKRMREALISICEHFLQNAKINDDDRRFSYIPNPIWIEMKNIIKGK